MEWTVLESSNRRAAWVTSRKWKRDTTPLEVVPCPVFIFMYFEIMHLFIPQLNEDGS
jgi:hypothetical protein